MLNDYTFLIPSINVKSNENNYVRTVFETVSGKARIPCLKMNTNLALIKITARNKLLFFKYEIKR